MAKFYVQSGSFRGIVDCYDVDCAAVWAIHRVMDRSQGVADRTSLNEMLDDSGEIVDEGLFALDDMIEVSEIGFDRGDCECVDTHEAFLHWHQLMKAIEVLGDRLDDMYE